jgi:glycosyltransferase involved in cell wall biosynthesis
MVIDGGSTDGGADLLQQYSNKLAYFCCEKDNGIFEAMNKGVERAKGEYSLFLNSGDYLSKKEILSEVFSTFFDEDIVFGNIIFKNARGKTKYVKCAERKALTIVDLNNNYIWHQATFIKTSLLRKLECYKTSFRIASDWDFFLRAFFKYGATHKHIPFFVSVFMTNGISFTNIKLSEEERDKSLKEEFPLLFNDIKRLLFLEKAWRIPGVKFLMKYVYPVYRKLRGCVR